MAEVAFDFKEFINETKSIILTPGDYFTSMPKTGGLTDPLIKAVIYSLVASFINFILVTFALVRSGGIFVVMPGSGLMVLIVPIFVLIVALFVGSTIVLVISAICGGNTDFESNVRVTSCLMVIIPCLVFFEIFYGINIWFGGIVKIAISVYGFWILYNALVKSLSAQVKPAKIISLILSGLVIVFIFSDLRFKTSVDRPLSEMPVNSIPEDYQNQYDEARKAAADSLDMMDKTLPEERGEINKQLSNEKNEVQK